MDNIPNTMDNNKTPASYDPGWNDPPKFSYTAQQTTPNRPRNFLNKRVAFPLSNNSPGNTTAPPINLPPMPAVPLIPLTPQNQPQRYIPTNEENTEIDSESTLIEVKSILLEFLENSSELGPKAVDIKRRLEAMEEMWKNGKLNNRIHLLMKDLAIALRDDVPAKADEIHKILMVDHVSCVGTWMPGVKQLIHHCIARSELLSIDKETDEVEN